MQVSYVVCVLPEYIAQLSQHLDHDILFTCYSSGLGK